uniref:WAP domain-containing protein n=1 Tax=Gouania willdenowi TaxID=441366 RepID=A0A8C5FZR9_GOUWI
SKGTLHCNLGKSFSLWILYPSDKPGTCPRELPHCDSSLCNTWWKCNNDYDCPGENKCCNTGCGQRCTNLGKDN